MHFLLLLHHPVQKTVLTNPDYKLDVKYCMDIIRDPIFQQMTQEFLSGTNALLAMLLSADKWPK